MRTMYILILLAAILSSCATVNQSDTVSQKSPVQQKEITVEEGVFLFRDLTIISERYLGPKLKGNVINNTTKDWNEVIFAIELYDQAGNKLKGDFVEEFYFIINNIKKGETKSIGSGYGESLIGIRDATISKYEIRFKSGEYPAKYVFKMTKPAVSNGLDFKDSFILIQFSISNKQLSFVLYNKTENPIKIDWNQVSYVDILGQSHKVMHSGIKYIDRQKIQSPTVIPPSAKIADIIFPSDYAYFTSGSYGGWREVPLFPEAPKAKLFKGRSFSVFMPLEINETSNNYYFTFQIDDIIF